MRAGGRGLAAGPDAVEAGAAVRVGEDAAHVEVACRTNGDGRPGRFEAGRAAVTVDGRELLGETFADRGATIEEGAATGGDLGVDGAGDDIARRELRERVDPRHEPFARRIDQ